MMSKIQYILYYLLPTTQIYRKMHVIQNEYIEHKTVVFYWVTEIKIEDV